MSAGRQDLSVERVSTERLNGVQVRAAFEDRTVYFVWSDFAHAIGLPETNTRRIPKTIYAFEKKNIHMARRNDGVPARTLCVNTCGLYRWLCETKVPGWREAVDWVMRVYTERGSRENAILMAEKRNGADIEDGSYIAKGGERRSPTRESKSGSSKNEIMNLVRANLELLTKAIEMEDDSDE